MPQDFFNQDIVGQFNNEELAQKARKSFVKTPRFKKNPAQDNPLSVAKQKFGDPVQESAIKIANKANVDPRFTKTTARQNTPRTIESAMKEYDLHRYGFATNGDPQYNDSDRKHFKEALDVHIYGGKGNNGEAIPPSKDGSIPPGKWAQMLDSLKSRTGNDVLSLGRELKSNPELNLQDETATAIADTFKGATKLPAQVLSAPIENITNEAMPDGSAKNFIQGVNPLLSQVITGPVGVASGFADMFGSVTSGEASDQIKGIIDTSKSILDTKADPGTRLAGAVNIGLMAWGALHGFKSLKGSVKALKAATPAKLMDDIVPVLDKVEADHGPEVRQAVESQITENPEGFTQALEQFDTKNFTDNLKAQEGPLEVGTGAIDKSRLKLDAGGETGTPAVPDTGPSGQTISPDVSATNGGNPPAEVLGPHETNHSPFGTGVVSTTRRWYVKQGDRVASITEVGGAKVVGEDVPRIYEVKISHSPFQLYGKGDFYTDTKSFGTIDEAIAAAKDALPRANMNRVEYGNPHPSPFEPTATGTTPETTPEPPAETPPIAPQTAPQETIPNKKTVQATDKANLQENVNKSTGLANQVQEREALARIINEVDKTTGKGKEHWQEAGKAEVDKGADYESLADRVGKGDEELTGLKVGILTEGKRVLLNHVNSLKAELDANPTQEIRAQYEGAQARLDNYLQNVQSGKGRWSDVGRALQAGTQLDTGNFAEVLIEAKRKAHYDPKQDAELQRLTEEVAKRDAEIERLKANPSEFDAKATISRVSPRRFNKAQIRTNIEQNRTRLKELVGSGGVSGPKTRGAVSKITVEDLKVSVEQARIIKDIALDHVRLGLANLEDVVIAVQKLLKEDGIDIDREAIVQSLTTTDPGKPKTEYSKNAQNIKSIARKLQSIASSKQQVETGEFVKKPKKVRTVTDEIANLEAQRRVWDSRVRNKLKEMETPKGKRLFRGAVNTIRGVNLGSDIGVLTRQGLFSLSRPKSFAKGVSNASKAMFSEENLAKWATATEEKRYSDGKSALRVRKEAGLSTTDSLSSHEELIIGPLAQKLFGRKIGGSLERFQTTFINTVRNELFDASYEKGLTPEELKTRARYINNVTGRGNLKSAPSDLANIIMTSPRYEASRWGTIGEYLRNPVEALGNKGARQNLQDLAVTSATVYALMQASQLAGYKLNFDPKSSDFLKMRKGNEVWDVTAGLAPRIRDVLRIALTMKDVATTGKMDFGTDIIKSAGKTVTRTISPAIKAPITEGLYSAQKHNGIAKPKDIFSGFSDDGEIHGWMAFAPLIVQSFWQSLTTEKKSLPESLGVATKEFVGTGVNFYPENKAKKKSSKFSPSFKRKRS